MGRPTLQLVRSEPPVSLPAKEKRMTFATSKNLTILGVAGILAALAAAATAIFDGDAATNPDWTATLSAVWTGVLAILAKGAKSTGGTVAETAEALKRVAG